MPPFAHNWNATCRGLLLAARLLVSSESVDLMLVRHWSSVNLMLVRHWPSEFRLVIDHDSDDQRTSADQ